MKKTGIICLSLALPFVAHSNALSQHNALSPISPISITATADSQQITALISAGKAGSSEGKGTRNDPAQPIDNGGDDDTSLNYIVTTSLQAPVFINLTALQSFTNTELTFSRPVKWIEIPSGTITIRDEAGVEHTITGGETNGKYTFNPPVNNFTIVSMSEDAAADLGLKFTGGGRARVTAKK
jgi:hypothetical protein